MIKLPTDKLAIEQGWLFNPDKAEAAVNWIESIFCMHLYRWQREVLETYFGWRNERNDYRFTDISCWIPKKNGKAFLIAALVGYKLFELKQARIYSSAFNSNQAKILMDSVIKIFKNSPKLAKQMMKRSGKIHAFCNPFRRDITVDYTGSKYQALADNVQANDGLIANVLVIDEIHRMKNTQVDVIEGSIVNIPDALKVIISTAGSGNKNERCWERYTEAKAILQGKRKDIRVLPVVFECTKLLTTVDEIYSLENLLACNPILSESPELLDNAKRELAAARDRRNDSWWKRFRLNQWLPEDGEAYISEAIYNGAEVESFPKEVGECYVGFDRTGGSFDFSAITALYPINETVYERHWVFVSADRLKFIESRDDRSYQKAIDAGEMIIVPADQVLDEFIFEWTQENLSNIKTLAADPFNAAYLLERWTASGINVVSVSQSNNRMLSPIIEEYANRVYRKAILHPQNALVSWQHSCCRRITTAKDCSKLVKCGTSRKGEGGSGHIDSIDATIFAMAALRQDEIQNAAYGNDAGISIG